MFIGSPFPVYRRGRTHPPHPSSQGEEGRIPNFEFEPLSKLRERGLIPFVKFEMARPFNVPTLVTRSQELAQLYRICECPYSRIHGLDINHVPPSIGHYFEGFLPTPRSMPLCCPGCAPRQLSRLFSQFSDLYGISIWRYLHLVLLYERWEDQALSGGCPGRQRCHRLGQCSLG